MLDDYFSLEISGDGRLVSIPMVFDDHVPSFDALPVRRKTGDLNSILDFLSDKLLHFLPICSTFCLLTNP